METAAALLWTLGQGLGDQFTHEVEEAWTQTYGTLASVMIGADKGRGAWQRSLEAGRKPVDSLPAATYDCRLSK